MHVHMYVDMRVMRVSKCTCYYLWKSDVDIRRLQSRSTLCTETQVVHLDSLLHGSLLQLLSSGIAGKPKGQSSRLYGSHFTC